MKKEEFLPILKEISDKLDNKKIEHEIPFLHLDKKEFNYINIIIPYTVNAKELLSFLPLYEVKEEKDIIISRYKNFTFHFIKTEPQMWQFTFYYYCWMPLSNLIGATAKYLGLTYDRYGLRYLHKDGTSILISLNFQLILDFFGLPFDDYIRGFGTENIIYGYYSINSFFCPDLLNETNIKKVDRFYELNKQYYDHFYDYIKVFSNFDETIEDNFYYYYIVDGFFPEIDFMKKIYRLVAKRDLSDIAGQLREPNDFEQMEIRDILSRALEAEKKYQKHLNEKRLRRKNLFVGMAEDIIKNSDFKFE